MTERAILCLLDSPFFLFEMYWGLGLGLLGQALGLVVGLVVGRLTRPGIGLALGLTFGLVGVLTGLLFGLSAARLDEHLHVTPNQGIQRSGRNALLVGLATGLVVGLVVGLPAVSVFGPIYGLFSGLAIGLVVGLLIGLVFGGVAYVAHYTLRFLLWRSGTMPWRYVRFLDQACERILLQRVGGGFGFIHPLFLDYFASGVAASSSASEPPAPLQA